LTARHSNIFPAVSVSHSSSALEPPLIRATTTPAVGVIPEWRRPRWRVAPPGTRTARALTLAGTLNLTETQPTASHRPERR